MAGVYLARIDAGGLLPTCKAVIAHGALLHYVLLMLGNALPSDLVVDGVLRLLPVKRAYAVIRTCGHAHTAPDALIVVLAHGTGLGILERGTYWTHLHAGGVLAVLTCNRIVQPMQRVGIGAARRVRTVATVGKQVIPSNIVRNVVLDLACENACLATIARRGIDDEPQAACDARTLGFASHG